MSVWIGEIQWMRRNGFAESARPDSEAAGHDRVPGRDREAERLSTSPAGLPAASARASRGGSFCPLPFATRSTIRSLSMADMVKRTASGDAQARGGDGGVLLRRSQRRARRRRAFICSTPVRSRPSAHRNKPTRRSSASRKRRFSNPHRRVALAYRVQSLAGGLDPVGSGGSPDRACHHGLVDDQRHRPPDSVSLDPPQEREAARKGQLVLLDDARDDSHRRTGSRAASAHWPRRRAGTPPALLFQRSPNRSRRDGGAASEGPAWPVW